MSDWASVTADELRAEIDAYMGDETMSIEEGWYTVDELMELYGMAPETVRRMLAQLMAQGRVTRGKRPARGVDGRRIMRNVYQLVDLGTVSEHDALS